MKSRTLLAAAVGMAFAVPHAQARITTVTIDNALSQNPAFGGHEIPGVGKYQKILGVACGELNPSDPKKFGIACRLTILLLCSLTKN